MALRRVVADAAQRAVTQGVQRVREQMERCGITTESATLPCDSAVSLNIELSITPDDNTLMEELLSASLDDFKSMAIENCAAPPFVHIAALRFNIPAAFWMLSRSCGLGRASQLIPNLEEASEDTHAHKKGHMCNMSSRSAVYDSAQYRATLPWGHACRSRLVCAVGTIVAIEKSCTAVLAEYYRCLAADCTGPLVMAVGAHTEAPRCTACRAQAVRVDLLTLSERRVLVHMRFDAFGTAMPVALYNSHVPSVGSNVLVAGHAVTCLERKCASVAIEAVSLVLLSETISSKRIVVCSRSAAQLCVFLARQMSALRASTRVLQLVRALTCTLTDAETRRIAILSNGDAWHAREAAAVCGPGRTGFVYNQTTASERASQINNSTVVVFEGTTRDTHRCGIVLDWRNEEGAVEYLISLAMEGKSTTASCEFGTSEYTGLAASGPIFAWTKSAKALMQAYYVAFRGVACTLNDSAACPMHNAERQAGLLRSISESAALMLACPMHNTQCGAKSGSIAHTNAMCRAVPVSDDAAALAAAVGEILLAQRYAGRSVLRDAPIGEESAPMVVPPSPVSDAGGRSVWPPAFHEIDAKFASAIERLRHILGV